MTRSTKLITLLLSVGAATAFVVGILALANKLPGSDETYQLRTAFPSTSSLGRGANVTIAGILVGHVGDVRRERGRSVVELDIDERHAPLPEGTRVGLRLRTAVGENYVELTPGNSPTNLSDGAELPAASVNDYVDVDTILESLRGPTRERAREMIQGVGSAVGQRGPQLNRTVRGASTFITDAAPVTDVLDDERRSVARLVDELGQVSAAVGQRSDAIRRLAIGGRRTFAAIADRDAAMGSTLERLPRTLRQVRATTGVVRRVTKNAAPVLHNLSAAIRDVEPALRTLKPAAVEGRALLAEVGRTAPALSTTLRKAKTLSMPTLDAIPQIRRAFCQLNPVAKYLTSYSKDIIQTLVGMGSAANYYDANGHAARLQVNIGQGSLRAFDGQTNAIIAGLLKAGLGQTNYNYGYSTTPAPGQPFETADGNSPTGPTKVTKTYPRIKAEC